MSSASSASPRKAETIRYLHQAPSLWPLYRRAALGPGERSDKPLQLPDLTTELLGVNADSAKLQNYRKVCGYASRHSVPVTWPHILAFPLQLRLLTDAKFPLPLLGLVHLRNEIRQRRPIGIGECLDLTCRLGPLEKSRRGYEFDLITTAFSGGQAVWCERATTLHRVIEKASTSNSAPTIVKPDKTRPKLQHYANTLEVKAPEDIGRRYARVSGDYNLIHLHALTARAFGFKRAIAHGMWSLSHLLAKLEQSRDWPENQTLQIVTQFKTPLFLPNQAQLNWQCQQRQDQGQQLDYQLLNAKGDAPHLMGQILFGELFSVF